MTWMALLAIALIVVGIGWIAVSVIAVFLLFRLLLIEDESKDCEAC